MKEEIKNTIIELVERFARNKDVYKNSKYNETQLRREFLDPFFSALGWDMDNKHGHAEQYKDIIHEDAIKIKGTTKAPDYSFRIGGVRKFFVEAKKPSVDIKYNIHPSFQLRRYAWSAKLPISILTDFEEFSVYDCRIKPNKDDKASVARIYYQTFDHYLEDLDFLCNTFSRDAILKGSFDKYTETATKKRGTSEVDQEFLKEIENWRYVLAKNIALRNIELSIYELNRIVQLTIDRVIFLRIAEDRGVEEYRNLFNIAKKKNIYKALFAVYVQADEKYNSGIFDFTNDLISKNILIDDKVLKPILQKLYYPDSPYEFSVLPSDILGNIYEQFLGKTIRLTPSHQAKIEEKPEVRKAGGVYYTPRYIVDYIVKNTVGEKIKGKTPIQISKLTICDPACGSGSFLIQAYQYLLDYHIEFYQSNTKKYKDKIIEIGYKSYQLTTKEKKRILLNNIYGVDIDPQAVEVTKLSLLLKVLEGENRETLNKTRQLFHERALPNLSNNIKCGNSLIGTDFYDAEDMALFGNEDMRRINAFDWDKEFPQIFKSIPNKIPLKKGGKLSEAKLGDVTANSGFDVVIGNPPWVFTKYVSWGEKIKIYIQENYLLSDDNRNKTRAKQSGKINLFTVFILIGIDILKKRGIFGYIVPNTILRTTTYDIVRKKILDRTNILKIVDLKSKVFEGVIASSVIIVLQKGFSKDNSISVIDNPVSIKKIIDKTVKVNQNNFIKNISYSFNIFLDNRNFKIVKKITNNHKLLGEYCKYIIEGIVAHKHLISNIKLDNSYPLLEGKSLNRYIIFKPKKYLIWDISKIHRTRPDYIWEQDVKLIIRRISGGRSPVFAAIDFKKFKTFASINNLVLKECYKHLYKYMLALLNSKVINYYYSINFSNRSNLTVNISKTYLEKLPIPEIDCTNKKEQQTHDMLVALVDKMLETQKLYHTAILERDKRLYKQKIDIVDNKIDKIVYELYGLTDKEIQIVEKM